jgi:hypothetical protein
MHESQTHADVGFEVLTEFIMKNSIFWAIMSFETDPMCSACYLLYTGFFLSSFLNPEDRSSIFLQNVDWHSRDYTLYLDLRNVNKFKFKFKYTLYLRKQT